jgi:hypothetical protein
MKLSFLFLGDGPCGEQDWRPAESATQWWGRRDAITRICSLSMWADLGTHNGVTADTCFCFTTTTTDKDNSNKGSSNSSSNSSRESSGVGVSTYCLHAAAVTSRILTPSESAIVGMFKEATRKATASSSSSSFAHSSSSNKMNSLADDMIKCSVIPWIDSPLLTATQLQQQLQQPHTASKLKSGNSSNNNNTSSNDTKSGSGSVGVGLGKRELIEKMQRECDIQFLRTHGLNGPLELILKKKNKTAVDDAYIAWKSSSSSSAAVSTGSDDEGTVKLETLKGKLLHTFAGLFTSMMTSYNHNNSTSNDSSQGPIGYTNMCLLLLHEDYPTELPVFGTNTSSSSSEQADIRLVICSMGAVRDMSDLETECLLTAAHRLGVRVVGCNLGRTAEFTSKIVCALVGHCMTGRLAAAVNVLVASSSSSSSSSMRNKKQALSETAAQSVTKLAPVRGWTWDGHSTSTHSPALMTAVTSAAVPTHIQSHSCPVLIHAVWWADFLMSDVTTNVTQSSRLLPLVQLIVCTLWRSRINNEQQLQSTQDPSVDTVATDTHSSNKRKHGRCTDTDMPAHVSTPVQSKLSIVFKDGAVFTLDQHTLPAAMAKKHMAAPSEYQVLVTLIELLQSCRESPNNTGGDGVRMDRIIGGDLSSGAVIRALFGDNGLKRKHAKRLRILRVVGIGAKQQQTLPVDHTSTCLSEYVYSKNCHCNDAADGDDDDIKSSTVLALMPNSSSPQTCEQEELDITQAVQECVINNHTDHDDKNNADGDCDQPAAKKSKNQHIEKKSKTVRIKYLCATTVPNYITVSPGFTMTMVQHWAYHGRLVEGIDEAIRDG